MSEYTPTTDEVRETYRRWKYRFDFEEGGPEFDRWLAAQAAEVKAEALEEAARKWLQGAWGDTPRRSDRVADRMAASQFAGDWMKAEAARHREGKEQ